METGVGAILLVIGVVALFAAIVGGGVKIKEIEVGNLPSRWRQSFLAIFGVVVGLTGLALVTGVFNGGNTTEPPQNVENAEENTSTNTESTAETNGGDQNANDANATDANDTQAGDSNSGTEAGQ
jgi:cytoskeletal protein RodZ